MAQVLVTVVPSTKDNENSVSNWLTENSVAFRCEVEGGDTQFIVQADDPRKVMGDLYAIGSVPAHCVIYVTNADTGEGETVKEDGVSTWRYSDAETLWNAVSPAVGLDTGVSSQDTSENVSESGGTYDPSTPLYEEEKLEEVADGVDADSLTSDDEIIVMDLGEPDTVPVSELKTPPEAQRLPIEYGDETGTPSAMLTAEGETATGKPVPGVAQNSEPETQPKSVAETQPKLEAEPKPEPEDTATTEDALEAAPQPDEQIANAIVDDTSDYQSHDLMRVYARQLIDDVIPVDLMLDQLPEGVSERRRRAIMGLHVVEPEELFALKQELVDSIVEERPAHMKEFFTAQKRQSDIRAVMDQATDEVERHEAEVMTEWIRKRMEELEERYHREHPSEIPALLQRLDEEYGTALISAQQTQWNNYSAVMDDVTGRIDSIGGKAALVAGVSVAATKDDWEEQLGVWQKMDDEEKADAVNSEQYSDLKDKYEALLSKFDTLTASVEKMAANTVPMDETHGAHARVEGSDGFSGRSRSLKSQAVPDTSDRIVDADEVSRRSSMLSESSRAEAAFLASAPLIDETATPDELDVPEESRDAGGVAEAIRPEEPSRFLRPWDDDTDADDIVGDLPGSEDSEESTEHDGDVDGDTAAGDEQTESVDASETDSETDDDPYADLDDEDDETSEVGSVSVKDLPGYSGDGDNDEAGKKRSRKGIALLAGALGLAAVVGIGGWVWPGFFTSQTVEPQPAPASSAPSSTSKAPDDGLVAGKNTDLNKQYRMGDSLSVVVNGALSTVRVTQFLEGGGALTVADDGTEVAVTQTQLDQFAAEHPDQFIDRNQVSAQDIMAENGESTGEPTAEGAGADTGMGVTDDGTAVEGVPGDMTGVGDGTVDGTDGGGMNVTLDMPVL